MDVGGEDMSAIAMGNATLEKHLSSNRRGVVHQPKVRAIQGSVLEALRRSVAMPETGRE